MSRALRAAACACWLSAVVAGQSARAAVPSPESFFDFRPGTDRRLADYDEIRAYFAALDAASDRVETEIVGETTEGRPFLVAYVSSAENLRRREEIRRDNLRLADPASHAPGEAEALIARGKTIVLLNASIHSVEVGPTQATTEIAHRLATADEGSDLRRVLDDVVLVLTPCHNPDGYARQVAWYRRFVGTPFEAAPLPEVYNKYVGHDNNRDWFLFTQVESRLTIDRLHAPWRPQIAIDQHQMGPDGPRIFTPPYQEPVEPHVDAALLERLDALGAAVRADFSARGLRGLAQRALFDAWSPSRAYVHYHGGVRVLTEIASAKQASPLEFVRPKAPWNAPSERMPEPWEGGRWTLADIVRYDVEAALSVLRHASRDRAAWLRAFRDALARAATPIPGFAGYELTAQDGGGLSAETERAVRRTLDYGGLDYALVAAAGRGGRRLFVPSGQRFFPFAQCLFENTPYPTVRDDGRLRRPYDASCHHLPTFMGFAAVRRAEAPPLVAADAPPPAPVRPAPDARPRLAIYGSHIASMDEGWLRYFCDERGFAFERFTDDDVRRRLVARDARGVPRLVDGGPRVLALPDVPRAELDAGLTDASVPPEFRGGLGAAGAAAVRDFVIAGGALVAFKGSAPWAIDLCGLPLANALLDADETRTYLPGSAVRLVDPSPHSPLAARDGAWPAAGDGIAAYFDGTSKAWRVSAEPEGRPAAPAPQSLYVYADAARLVLGGYAEGAERVADRIAVARCDVGRGRVVLFGFVPYFRHLTRATFPLVEAALVDVR